MITGPTALKGQSFLTHRLILFLMEWENIPLLK